MAMKIRLPFRKHKEGEEKKYSEKKQIKLQKPHINLSESIYIINPYGDREKEEGEIEKDIDEETKELFDYLYKSYGSVIIFDGEIFSFAAPFKCVVPKDNRPGYRVGVFVKHLNDEDEFVGLLEEIKNKIREEAEKVGISFGEFYDSANRIFNLQEYRKREIGHIITNSVFKRKRIRAKLGGLYASDILIREKYPFSFYICAEDEEVQKWDFDIIVTTKAKESEEEYSEVYDEIDRSVQRHKYKQKPDALESIVESALKKVDFYPPEYIEFLWNKGEIEKVGGLLSKGKISKKELGQFSTEGKFELMEQGIEFPLEVENIRDIILRKKLPSISRSAMESPSIRDIVLEKEGRMLEKIPPSKISLTLRDYGYEIKNSKEARVLLNDYFGRKLHNKSLEELDEEGGVELLAKLLKGGFLDEKICGSVINKIVCKNDLRILCKKEVIWNKWEGKIRKRWKEIPQEVEEEIYEL